MKSIILVTTLVLIFSSLMMQAEEYKRVLYKGGKEYISLDQGITWKEIRKYKPKQITNLKQVAGVGNIEMIAHPNPCYNVLKLNLTDKSVEKIEITDVRGHVLIISQNNEIDVSKLVSGTYFVVISSQSNQFVKKIIKL